MNISSYRKDSFYKPLIYKSTRVYVLLRERSLIYRIFVSGSSTSNILYNLFKFKYCNGDNKIATPWISVSICTIFLLITSLQARQDSKGKNITEFGNNRRKGIHYLVEIIIKAYIEDKKYLLILHLNLDDKVDMKSGREYQKRSSFIRNRAQRT